MQPPPLADWLRPYEPLARAIVCLLDPLGEVVVHDIESDTIAGIWGHLTGRAVGDESLLGEIPAYEPGDDFIDRYERVMLDGRHIASVSVILRDSDGLTRGVMCINIDRSRFEMVEKLLGDLFRPVAERPKPLFERDWREQIALIVDDFCSRNAIRRTELDKNQRLDLLRELDSSGLFETRHAAAHVARALGLSRASIYASLKEARS